MFFNTICVCVGIGQNYHFRIPVDYYPEDSVVRHQNGKFSTGELVGIEGEFGVFLASTDYDQAVKVYIRGGLTTSLREDVMSLDRFIELSLGR